MEAAEAERVAAEMAEDSMPDAPPVPSIMVAQVRPLPSNPWWQPHPSRGVRMTSSPPALQVAPPPAGPVGGFEL